MLLMQTWSKVFDCMCKVLDIISIIKYNSNNVPYDHVMVSKGSLLSVVPNLDQDSQPVNIPG